MPISDITADPGMVGIIMGTDGTVEHFLGNCDPGVVGRLSAEVLRLFAQVGPTWVEIATNGMHTVYCWLS
jgi:hypothetical protein